MVSLPESNRLEDVSTAIWVLNHLMNLLGFKLAGGGYPGLTVRWQPIMSWYIVGAYYVEDGTKSSCGALEGVLDATCGLEIDAGRACLTASQIMGLEWPSPSYMHYPLRHARQKPHILVQKWTNLAKLVVLLATKYYRRSLRIIS
ncbi:hypothetical protein EAI_01287 [Harpegnathos saltator]|uniref:Uncharacterized protein n=1 Tax=Harpegnathos saltator TaxID=610380 RepID=E2B8K9_HARSA|nr:hypothetical protein EAI_01287 [Harpegnathos saltator]